MFCCMFLARIFSCWQTKVAYLAEIWNFPIFFFLLVADTKSTLWYVVADTQQVALYTVSSTHSRCVFNSSLFFSEGSFSFVFFFLWDLQLPADKNRVFVWYFSKNVTNGGQKIIKIWCIKRLSEPLHFKTVILGIIWKGAANEEMVDGCPQFLTPFHARMVDGYTHPRKNDDDDGHISPGLNEACRSDREG